MTSETSALHSAKDIDAEQLGSALLSSEPCVSNRINPTISTKINRNLCIMRSLCFLYLAQFFYLSSNKYVANLPFHLVLLTQQYLYACPTSITHQAKYVILGILSSLRCLCNCQIFIQYNQSYIWLFLRIGTLAEKEMKLRERNEGARAKVGLDRGKSY